MEYMIAELRAGFLLGMALVFFLIIIAIFAFSMVMRPDRWSERTHSGSRLRSTTSGGVSPAA
jgi:preprotein translocase subunit YajC